MQHASLAVRGNQSLGSAIVAFLSVRVRSERTLAKEKATILMIARSIPRSRVGL